MTTTLISEILDLSRQSRLGELTAWFRQRLDREIDKGSFARADTLGTVMGHLIDRLKSYREHSGRQTVVIGMSGGVDSALTAALFRAAGWQVKGYTLPIEQNPEETARGQEACAALGVGHTGIDLTPQYKTMIQGLAQAEPDLLAADDRYIRIRKGNVRARLRMITLYDQAHRFGGIVASTDNFSELAAGFWTLNGDVGDVAPIQSLLKSWEVPWMAREIGVPERTWRATPTDGLGISAGDEAQLGASYLQWDLMVLAMSEAVATGQDLAGFKTSVSTDTEALRVLDSVCTRMRQTTHKRRGTYRLDHPMSDRYAALDLIDRQLGALQPSD